MDIVELLKKISEGKIKNGSLFHGGDLFYNLIVLDSDLYVINEITKQIYLLESHHIGNFILNNYKLYEYKKVID